MNGEEKKEELLLTTAQSLIPALEQLIRCFIIQFCRSFLYFFDSLQLNLLSGLQYILLIYLNN